MKKRNTLERKPTDYVKLRVKSIQYSAPMSVMQTTRTPKRMCEGIRKFDTVDKLRKGAEHGASQGHNGHKRAEHGVLKGQNTELYRTERVENNELYKDTHGH